MSSPSISVIVTVRNDAENLRLLLSDLGEQTLQPQTCILAVADSEDDTMSVARDFAKRNKNYQVLSVGQATRSKGRNLAVERADTDILVFTDAGCRLDQAWLRELVAPFHDTAVSLVSGLTVGAPQSKFEAAQVPFVLVAPDAHEPSPLPATRNMAVRRTIFNQVKPFSESLQTAEDFEWARRARVSGVDAVFAPKAVVAWRPRRTPTEFWKMIFALTQGDVQASTWRKGHISMLLRYVLIVGTILFWPFLGFTVWLLYLVMKATWISRKHQVPWVHTIFCQFLADTAVCSGILSQFGRK